MNGRTRIHQYYSLYEEAEWCSGYVHVVSYQSIVSEDVRLDLGFEHGVEESRDAIRIEIRHHLDQHRPLHYK